MAKPFQRLRRFLSELRRRNVYRVAVTYAVVAFVVWQVANLLFPALGFPAWTIDFVIVLTLLGFPLALVLAWAFEMTPEGMRRTAEAEPAGESEAPEAGTRTGYKVLVGLGLVAAAVAGGWYLIGGGESPEVSGGTVAVLPFEVAGSAEDGLRDGMVSLLSTGLDGAAGLRAIPYQTVLATWERSGPDEARATVEEALAAARRSGGRYGVVGTVTGVGSELQLSATAYETTSGDRLGQVEVSGSPDSVTVLAGELTRRMLGLLAAETGEGLEAADLASVMTRSDTALKAFLAGERHLRAGNESSAIKSYEAAIRADSTFALPYARLGMIGVTRGALEDLYVRRAHEMSEQLPERQRRLVRALYQAGVEYRTLAARDSLRRLTKAYPDDPWIWAGRGLVLEAGEIPRGLPEIEKVFGRAAELAPGFTPHHTHYVEATLALHRDSALAARRVDSIPNEEYRRIYRLVLGVIFGNSARRQQALAAFDTVPMPARLLPFSGFRAPQDAKHLDAVLRRVIERDDLDFPYETVLINNDLIRGQIEQALADVRQWAVDADNTACLLAGPLTLGYPVPDSVAAQYPDPDRLHDEMSPAQLYCTGFYLVERGRGEELEDHIQRLREAADTTEEDGASAGLLEASVRELRGYRAWKRGDLDRAVRLWNRTNEFALTGAILRGNLYRNLDQLKRAEGWYLAAWRHPVAHERLGQLYEEMGRPKKAAAAYRRFTAAWEDADPELQPRVEAARKRLKKLTAAEAETNE